MPNTQFEPDSTLTTFGGLVTELNPADLPAGSSPLCCDCDFTIGSVKTRLGLSSVYMPVDTGQNFNYVKSYETGDGSVLTLALDTAGNMWYEAVAGMDEGSDPGVLTPFFSGIDPNSFAKSVTYDDREFIAISDLQEGTDIPRQFSVNDNGIGFNFDRISQVGPGAGCQITSTTLSYPVNPIFQIAPQTLGDGSSNYYMLWSAGPTLNTPGNVITFYGLTGTTWGGAQVDPPASNQLQPGDNVVITGLQTISGFNPNNGAGGNPVYYTVTSIGTARTSGGTIHPIFTIQVNQIGFFSGHPQAGSTYQPTLATVVASTPVPNLQEGQQLTISGASPSTWDGTFTVLFTLNAAQMSITNTELLSNEATYAFTLISGVTPAVGQMVTVTGTSNGNGIFNVTSAIITAATSSTFSVAIVSPNIASAPETAFAIINGTKFQFDPLQIIATSTTGSLVVAGLLGAGVRGAVVLFLTTNGYLTAPSPQTIFTLSGSANSIIASQIPIGPDNVVARVIAFTGAGGATLAGGGGYYYWIPEDVSVISNNQTVNYTKTIINDNTSTSATFTFTDAVLLGALSISFQGTNNFAQIELGSCLGTIAYANRLFVWGENNKIQNLINMTFDGGAGKVLPVPTDPSTIVSTYPLGWTPDSVYGAGIVGGGITSVVDSPVFGDAYQIQTISGGLVIQGMIEQPAFEDSFTAQTIKFSGTGTHHHTRPTISITNSRGGAPIIQTNTQYSIRFTAQLTAGSNSDSGLNVDLYSPSFGKTYGIFGCTPTAAMQTFEADLLDTPLATVPTDLILRVYAISHEPFMGVNFYFVPTYLIDRIEIYPTQQPVLNTQLRGSYVDNFEAFDGVTGNLGVGTQNQQPVSAAFTLFDNLYVVRTRSFCSTSDNGITEPDGWTIKEIAGIGTPSINGVDYSTDKDSESWALIAGQAGLYLFDGGKPQKLSPEIDTLWNAINWKYGYTLWVKNDIINRRICIGVPLATPNQWMPNFPVNANPTSPNVVLMLSYRELMSSGALTSEGPIRQSFMGELRTFQLGRKWSAWSIQASYADFITRADTTQPLFYCNNQFRGKIYQQLTGNYLDDGALMPWDYITSPMPKTQEAQALGMGNQMLDADMITALLTGNGNAQVNIYPDTITSPYALTLGTYPLSPSPAYGDTEIPVLQTGARFFLEVTNGGTTQAPANFELSRVVMTMKKAAWAAYRGSN